MSLTPIYVIFVEEPVEIIRHLKDQEISEKETAKFKCLLSKSGVKAKWLKDGKVVTAADGYEITSIDVTHTLVLEDVALEDGGKYTIKVEDKESSANLRVMGMGSRNFSFQFGF